MGQTILTPTQHKFLGLAQAEPEISDWFYLTGGTALAEFYLKHRLSEDLDFFSTSQVDELTIDNFLQAHMSQLNISSLQKDHIMGLYVYKLSFKNGESLKVDFNEYPFGQIERSNLKYGKLKVDSFYDIAVNKLYTVQGRLKIRDFIDLYFILKKKEFSLEQLMVMVEEKFTATTDLEYLSSQLLRVVDFPADYPTMLVPFSFEEMVDFYKKEAKRLGEKTIFKK